MGRFPNAIKGLLAANGLLFLLRYFGRDVNQYLLAWFALFFPQHPLFRPWQLVTSMFMHGSEVHILFNMFALVSFGSILENIWGSKRFLLFYFLAGVGSAIIYTTVNWIQFTSLHGQLIKANVSAAAIQAALETRNPNLFVEPMKQLVALYSTPAVGASGAIYGVLVAFGFYFPNAKLSLIFLPVPIAAKYFIPGLVALDLLSGVTGFSIFGGGIAHFAHIGGAVIGFLLMWYWKKPRPAQQSGFTTV